MYRSVYAVRIHTKFLPCNFLTMRAKGNFEYRHIWIWYCTWAHIAFGSYHSIIILLSFLIFIFSTESYTVCTAKKWTTFYFHLSFFDMCMQHTFTSLIYIIHLQSWFNSYELTQIMNLVILAYCPSQYWERCWSKLGTISTKYKKKSSSIDCVFELARVYATVIYNYGCIQISSYHIHILFIHLIHFLFHSIELANGRLSQKKTGKNNAFQCYVAVLFLKNTKYM